VNLYWLEGDLHATKTTAVNAFNMSTVIRRAYTPYGTPRGTATGTWPDNRSYLGDPTDPATGLVDVGARKYDPSLGVFISVDELLNTAVPQSMAGYSYSSANPVAKSDPTGLCDYCNWYYDIGLMAQWYGNTSGTSTGGQAGGSDYIAIEVTTTIKMRMFTKTSTVWKPTSAFEVILPGESTPGEVIKEGFGVTTCGVGLGMAILCGSPGMQKQSGAGASGVGGAQISFKMGAYGEPSDPKWIPVTFAVTYIYARNGRQFISVAAGVTPTDEFDEPGKPTGSVAIRWGYFNSPEPLSSDKINEELTGQYTEIGVTLNGIQTAVTRNSASGGTATEIGKELAFSDELFSEEFLKGTSVILP
jgi:RHS repeat-associated protein